MIFADTFFARVHTNNFNSRSVFLKFIFTSKQILYETFHVFK
jgi:hypothetical protein